MAALLASCKDTDSSAVEADQNRGAQVAGGEYAGFKVRELARGLQHPTSLLFLPDGNMLVSERAGRLRRVSRNGFVSAPLAGVPHLSQRGALWDIAVIPSREAERTLFLAFLEPRADGSLGATVARARLESLFLADVQIIHRQDSLPAGSADAGMQLAFHENGRLFIGYSGPSTTASMQPNGDVITSGTLLRVDASGRAPRTNPFAGPGHAALWTYGHGSIRGLAFDPRTGKLWMAENGPGDSGEINIAKAGRSFALIAANAADIAAPLRAEPQAGIPALPEAPRHAWSQAPQLSGLAFYTGRPGAPWNDSVFVGSTDGGYVTRLMLSGDRVVGEERLLQDKGLRVADVQVDTDGDLFVLTEGTDGRLLQITPPDH